MSEFAPHPLLRLAHVQTIAAALWTGRSGPARIEPRTFRTDSETSVVALCNWQPERKKAPTLLALHGLTGHADAPYLRGLAAKAHRAGLNVVRLNTRNCGGTAALTPTLYHSGLTADARGVVETLAGEGLENIHLVGFSMGGNVALKLAGELGEDAPFRSVAAVSPPIALARASAAIDRGLVNAIYQRSFLRSLKALIRVKAVHYPDRYDLTGLEAIRTLRVFDERYIAPCFGFAGADDYYEKASAARVVDAIAVPVLVIHARDDSIIPIEDFELWRQRSSAVRFLITDHGGHAGFIARGAGEDPFWAENRIVEFVLEASI